ncbi:hypothetical protein K504DRAFT_446231 [Pleomassaria siparia CBS 279.74]|uniref:Uncharacterized protein n=1 Tax=Pleomassaria siparia CBS 279.74 TaxID=1314801 RepID=A0A6G1KRC5_9PLEO|nr:hypothetical protein K504DRAFT_446231 [Pleomassaria siparia CBS 279.74]
MASTYQCTGLIDLPDELLLHIAGYLHIIRTFQTQAEAFKSKELERTRQRENHLRQKTLYALCLSSRRLRSVAEPVLYSALLSLGTRNGKEKTALFYRTIFQTPALARHIQYVENRFDDHLGNTLADAFEDEDAVEAVQNYFDNLASIILNAPNIQHLSLVSLETNEISIWRHFRYMPHARVLAHGFSKLQIMCIQIQTSNTGFEDDFACFRYIAHGLATVPALHTLKVSGVVTSRASQETTTLPGKFEFLETVEISDCMLDFDEVIQFTSGCKELKYFKCHWAYINAGDFPPSYLCRGLLPHKHNLESLHLDMRDAGHRTGHSAVESLGCLREFTSLRSITMCGAALFAATLSQLVLQSSPLLRQLAELLPSSIENLTLLLKINKHDMEVFSVHLGVWLVKFTEDCAAKLPNLKNLSIMTTPVAPFSAPPVLTMLFKDVGINLRFSHVGSTDDAERL